MNRKNMELKGEVIGERRRKGGAANGS